MSFYGQLLATPEGRELLKDPERRRFLYDREARTGLLEDSIIGDELYVPNKEGMSLERRYFVAGRFAGYDFHRPEEFKSVAKNRERQNTGDRSLLEELNLYIENTVFKSSDLTKCSFRQINNPPFNDATHARAAVIDTNDDGFSVFKIGNADFLVECHAPHCTG